MQIDVSLGQADLDICGVNKFNFYLLIYINENIDQSYQFQHSLLARDVLLILSLKINLPDQFIGLSIITQGRDYMYNYHHKERFVRKPKPNGIKVSTQLTMGSINEAKLSNHMKWFLSQAQ